MQNLLRKLITHEDPYYIHKTFGLICLSNYFVQYYLYFVYGVYYLDWFTILPHILLNASSFIFIVLKNRPTETKMNMFIWEELRIHSLLFAWRACFCILFPSFKFYICLITLILADVTTNYHGTPNVSTVRGQHHKVGSRSFTKEFMGAFFSVSQFGATYICFYSSPILTFSTLAPIQTSSFGMTLIRKNLITKTTWSLVYSLELLITYYIWYCEYRNLDILFISLFLYFLRRQNISKYLLWLSVYFIRICLDYLPMYGYLSLRGIGNLYKS